MCVPLAVSVRLTQRQFWASLGHGGGGRPARIFRKALARPSRSSCGGSPGLPRAGAPASYPRRSQTCAVCIVQFAQSWGSYCASQSVRRIRMMDAPSRLKPLRLSNQSAVTPRPGSNLQAHRRLDPSPIRDYAAGRQSVRSAPTPLTKPHRRRCTRMSLFAHLNETCLM